MRGSLEWGRLAVFQGVHLSAIGHGARYVDARPVHPRWQTDTFVIAVAKLFHAIHEQINALVQGRLFRLEGPPAEGWGQLLGDLVMAHGIPLPDDTAVLVVYLVVDLGLGESLNILVVGAVQVCIVLYQLRTAMGDEVLALPAADVLTSQGLWGGKDELVGRDPHDVA